MNRALLCVCLAISLLAGCGMFELRVDSTLAGAPEAIRSRTVLPACGAETARGDVGAKVDGRRCLWSAYQEHRPAEFITTQWSTEGDPITSIYRILPDGAVEVFIDSTQDKWSARTWLHLACKELSLIEGAPAQPAFGPAGDCTETTIR